MSVLLLLTADLCPLDHNTLSMVVKNLAVSQWNSCGCSMYVCYSVAGGISYNFACITICKKMFKAHFNKECVSVLTMPVQN